MPANHVRHEIIQLLRMDDETTDALAEMLDLGDENGREILLRALNDLTDDGRVRSYDAVYADRTGAFEATWWSIRRS